MINKRLYWVNTILIMAYVTIALSCDILAYKPVRVFDGHYVVASAFLFMSLYAIIDILAQLNTRAFAITILVIHMVCDFFYTYVLVTFAHLPSPSFWHFQGAYNIVLDPITQLYWAGVVGSLISGVFDIYLFTKLQNYFKGRAFFISSFSSSIAALIVYTLITDYFAFKTYFSSHLWEILGVNLVSNITFSFLYCILSALVIRYSYRFLQDK